MAAINCKIRTNNNAMSLRSDVSQAGRDAVPADGARLQHVLQVGTVSYTHLTLPTKA